MCIIVFSVFDGGHDEVHLEVGDSYGGDGDLVHEGVKMESCRQAREVVGGKE